MEFTSDLTQVTVEFADGGGDDDGTVTITAYNLSNVQVAQGTLFFGSNPGIGTITVNAPDIRYFIAESDAPPGSPHSLAWDNMAVTPVPEPASMIALGVGIAALAARRRRKSAR